MRTLHSLIISIIAAALISGCAPSVGSMIAGGYILATMDTPERAEKKGSESVVLNQLCNETRENKNHVSATVVCSFVTGCTPASCK